MTTIKSQESPATADVGSDNQSARFKHPAQDDLQCRQANGRVQRDKIEEIMAAPVATMFKCAVVQARKGWMYGGDTSIRTGYQDVGGALARYIFSQDCDGEIAAKLNPMSDEQILQWLRRARSKYMALVPRRHHAKVLRGFVAEMEEM